jgi:nitrate reductase gamma subunit
MSSDLLFKTWPYLSMGLFAAGMLFRYLRSRRRIAVESSDAATGRIGSPGSMPLRLGLTLLLFGHLAGLLFPRSILAWNGKPLRLYLLESIAFVSGTAALLGWAERALRHVKSPVTAAAADLADTVFLSLLGVTLLAGLVSAALYRWSSSWGVLTVTPYVLSLLRGAPRPAFASQLPFPVQLHVAAPLAALALVPCTRLAPALLDIVRRPLRRIDAAASARVVAVRAFFAHHNPGRFLWPDED